MRETISVILAVLFLLVAVQPVQAQDKAQLGKIKEQIATASEYYSEGRIGDAERLVLKLLNEQNQLDGEANFLIYRLLAFCSIANDDENAGIQYFIQALEYNPTMSPDPVTWSPKIRRVFDNARQNYQIHQEQQRLLRFAAEAELCRRASSRSLFLPGSGQMMKGHKAQGALLTTLFIGASAAAIYGQVMLPGAKDDYRNARNTADAERLWQDFRDAQYFANGTGILALSIYCYSFFNALWSHPSYPDSTK